MDNVQLRYVFDRLRQANNDTKRGLLQIEVRLHGSNIKKLISTGVHLYRNQFSAKNGFTCRNHDNAPAITGKVSRMFRQIEAFVMSDKCRCLNDVRHWNKNNASLSVVEFMREQLRKSNPTPAVLNHHSALINRIDHFGKIKTFADITCSNICEFDEFVKQNGVRESSTLNKKHSIFRRYIRKAIYMDLCKKDPYEEFKMPSRKGKTPVYLEEPEIKKIQDYVPFDEKLEHIKNLFIFQIFTGMAYVDLMNFSREYVSELDGKKIIRSRREKTDESFITLFLPEAEKIADKYDYHLPKISNQKYNDYLKLLGVGAGIRKKLTTHVARHTFATYLLNRDIPIETVSKAMGHSNITMTQHYARLLGKKVVSDMSKLLV